MYCIANSAAFHRRVPAMLPALATSQIYYGLIGIQILARPSDCRGQGGRTGGRMSQAR